MLRRFSVNFAIFSMVVDAGLTMLALALAVAIRPLLPPTLPFIAYVGPYEIHWSLYLIVAVIWVGAFLFSSVYDPKRIYKVVDETQSVVLAGSLAALLFAGVLYLGFRDFSRWALVTFLLLNLVLLLGWRFVARFVFRVYGGRSRERRVLVVGAGVVGRRVGEMIGRYDWAGLRLVGYLDDDPHKQRTPLPILGRVSDVCRVVQQAQIEDVVIALPQRAYSHINRLVLDLHQLPVNVRVIPDYFSLALYRAAVDDFGGMPMISLRDPALNDVQRMVKRLFDLVVGSATTVMTLPLIAAIALLVRLDSPGPVFFRQERLGENGRTFKMVKFRTMILGAEKLQEKINRVNDDGRLIFKRPDDPRITRIGRFLRRTSLDELPQLFNVLKGEMSLVGPRPELPWMVDQYEMWQHKRFAVPQGMTGWWQVNGRSDRPMHLYTEDDIYYVQNYSIWMDLYILLKTPWVVLRGKGAY